MVNMIVVETNIPITRVPYAAGSVPPKAPYCNEDNVGSRVKPIFVEDRKITQSDASVGSEHKSIYLQNGEIKPGSFIQKITPANSEGIVIAKVTTEDGEVNIYAPGNTTVEDITALKLPLLTPMWFDHAQSDTVMWIPSSTYSVRIGTDNEIEEYEWIEYITNPDIRGYKEHCTKIYEHLLADYRSGTDKVDSYNVQGQPSPINIRYKLAADGHKIANVDQMENINLVYDDDSIGTAWYFVLDESQMSFRLPRTKYGFHGTRSLVKRTYPENHSNVAMRLYFCTGYTREDISPVINTLEVTPVYNSGTDLCKINFTNSRGVQLEKHIFMPQINIPPSINVPANAPLLGSNSACELVPRAIGWQRLFSYRWGDIIRGNPYPSIIRHDYTTGNTSSIVIEPRYRDIGVLLLNSQGEAVGEHGRDAYFINLDNKPIMNFIELFDKKNNSSWVPANTFSECGNDAFQPALIPLIGRARLDLRLYIADISSSSVSGSSHFGLNYSAQEFTTDVINKFVGPLVELYIIQLYSAVFVG